MVTNSTREGNRLKMRVWRGLPRLCLVLSALGCRRGEARLSEQQTAANNKSVTYLWPQHVIAMLISRPSTERANFRHPALGQGIRAALVNYRLTFQTQRALKCRRQFLRESDRQMRASRCPADLTMEMEDGVNGPTTIFTRSPTFGTRGPCMGR